MTRVGAGKIGATTNVASPPGSRAINKNNMRSPARRGDKIGEKAETEGAVEQERSQEHPTVGGRAVAGISGEA